MSLTSGNVTAPGAGTTTAGTGGSGLARWLPIVDWSREYGRGWVPRDGVAGITVWALMVSDAMAYAGIAGVPHGVRVAAMPEAGY
jgi:hypothetical protein